MSVLSTIKGNGIATIVIIKCKCVRIRLDNKFFCYENV